MSSSYQHENSFVVDTTALLNIDDGGMKKETDSIIPNPSAQRQKKRFGRMLFGAVAALTTTTTTVGLVAIKYSSSNSSNSSSSSIGSGDDLFRLSSTATGSSAAGDKEEKNQPVIVSELNPNCEARMLSDFHDPAFFSSKNHPNYAGTWKFSPLNGDDHYSCEGFCKACAGGYYDNACSSDGEWSCKIYETPRPEFKSCKFEDAIAYPHSEFRTPSSFTNGNGNLKCMGTTNGYDDDSSIMTITCEIKNDEYRGILYFETPYDYYEHPTNLYELSIIDDGMYQVDIPLSREDRYCGVVVSINHCK